MSPSAMPKKLGMRPGQRVLLLNAPPHFIESLGQLPEGVQLLSQPEGVADLVQLFVKDSQEFAAWIGVATAAVPYDGLFWIAYPKKSSKAPSDLSRDVVWKLMEGTGLRPVTQISLDDIWSALRFRPEDRVGR